DKHGNGSLRTDVKTFSRETWWLQPPTETLRKQLEEELKLSEHDVRSHAWYHGPIPTEVSESLLLNHGDFLVRDSQSSHGDFVLSSCWEQKTLHLPIRRTVVPSTHTYPRVQYSLEEGEGEEGKAFSSLQALVHFYVGGRAALTRGGGAQMVQPVNRTLPLSYLETRPVLLRVPLGAAALPGGDSPPKHLFSEHLERKLKVPQGSELVEMLSSFLVQSVDVTEPHQTLLLSPAAPPSSRTSSPNTTRPSPHRPSSDHCYTELCPGPQSYVDRLQAEDGVHPLRTEDGDVYFSPVMETLSCFKPSRYTSALMPQDNKPLEVGILRRVKEVLVDVDPRTAAKHITKADCTVARILQVTPEVQRMMGVSSGLELLTLPHGQQLRLDLLERFQTMAIMLAVHVLGCTGTSEERAGLLHKLIQVAAELKSGMGNMFGFAAVMRALELPQVSRLEQTWTALRQRHTEGAILYDKHFESFPLSSTTFPHMVPLLSLLEKSGASQDTEPWDSGDAGVDVVMFHLGAARTIAQLGGNYRSNAESKLQGFQEQPEVMELFLTDFQMRLLWGSRGAEADQALRYHKFQQVLTALSNKLEPPISKP
uniref:SH2 domain containing 3C n=1 Tax=Salarias fasciatus TaxID=181472 RepID=A0A672FVB2_SALFA